MLNGLKQLRLLARRLKNEITTLYLAARDPRTPWYAKAMIAGIVAYALSPIDLIPDFIPVLGYLDDLLLLPIGIYLALKLIPAEVLIDARRRASEGPSNLPKRWSAALIIIILWLVALVVVGLMIARSLDTDAQILIGG
jgi:uncharacterized membrane protein YkvA (DUF1232 family)